MAGVKGRSGGRRSGAGRHVAPKVPKPPRVHKPRGGVRPGAGAPPGSGAFKPTKEHHHVVEMAAACGLTLDQICLFVINPETNKPIGANALCKYFREDLDRGHPKALMRVATSLYNNAVQHNNVTAQIFWLKTRARWSEKLDITVRRPEDLSDEELDAALAAAITNDAGAEDPALAQLIATGEGQTRH